MTYSNAKISYLIDIALTDKYFDLEFSIILVFNWFDFIAATLMTLSKLLWDHDVPLMVVRSHGLLG